MPIFSSTATLVAVIIDTPDRVVPNPDSRAEYVDATVRESLDLLAEADCIDLSDDLRACWQFIFGDDPLADEMNAEQVVSHLQCQGIVKGR